MSEHTEHWCSNRIDHALVVRCKDCMNWSGKQTDTVGICCKFLVHMRAMDFCSRGELQPNGKKVE